MKKEKQTIESLLPKITAFLCKGTDLGNIVLMMKNAGFAVSLEEAYGSKRSKKDFINEKLIEQKNKGNLYPFSKLANLFLVSEYFRSGEYNYTYDKEEARSLSKILNSILSDNDPKKFYESLFDVLDFHPSLKLVSRESFVNGDYTKAVFEACKFLEAYVQNKINNLSENGVKLMSTAFNNNNGKLWISNTLDAVQKEEQSGFHLLTMGEVKYIRNQLAHKNSQNLVSSYEDAIKLICFVSFLIEQVEKMPSVN